MPFNSHRNGFQNETDFIRKMNNKRVCDIDFGLQLFIEDLFGELDRNSIITCFKNTNPQKCDMFIVINDVTKRISIKKGVKNSVHSEPISEFVHFLIENKMPRNIVINFLKYHYADGTTNGKGSIRQNIEDYKKSHQKEIDEINAFINRDEFLIKAIDRFVLLGRNSNVRVDAILYGVPSDFLWIKKEDIYRVLLRQKDKYSTSVHFSGLTYQPMNRCINRNPRYEKCRYISQVKWYNLCDDIIMSMN